ncbi:hypothetical protein GE09DRAFT_1062302 [Coniochaeta sp. 2T2.1]|nr:hypothetical protein GE09DRAFT_1062302 [Coniochaeta sp. 2T2.1]
MTFYHCHCTNNNSGSRPKETASPPTPVLRNVKGEIVISLHEFNDLKQETKAGIMLVYDKVMNPSLPEGNSYSRICKALRLLGVGARNAYSTPEDLLARWVNHANSLLFNGKTFDSEIIAFHASYRHWGLDELKAITAHWIQGNNEDDLTDYQSKPFLYGRQLMLAERVDYLVRDEVGRCQIRLDIVEDRLEKQSNEKLPDQIVNSIDKR